jgi:hypothetical protein
LTSTVDLSEFEALGTTSRRKPCAVALVLEKLDEADREKLEAAIAATPDRFTVGAVLAWLKQRDHQLVANHITHHRSGRCSCVR